MICHKFHALSLQFGKLEEPCGLNERNHVFQVNEKSCKKQLVFIVSAALTIIVLSLPR